MRDLMVNGRYRVDYKIGTGGFGSVYVGYDTARNEQVAIKFTGEKQDADEQSQTLRGEAEVCRAVGKSSSARGMPKLRWVGLADDFSALVTDLLGPSLTDLLAYCGGRFSLKTVLMIADQAIERLAWIHRKGYLHRDVKPTNFCFGAGSYRSVLHVIDMGLAKSWERAINDREHDQRRRGFCGTTEFASINAHYATEMSKHDDLESLGYTLIFLLRGQLPWSGQHSGASTGNEHAPVHLHAKLRLIANPGEVDIPQAFIEYLRLVQQKEWHENPDYSGLRKKFSQLFFASGFTANNVFDWIERRFNEIVQEWDGNQGVV